MKRRILRKGALVVAVVAMLLIFSGCFWTADNAGEGGVALKIDASEIGGSGVGASQMVGSQESPSDSFVIAFVIADDLLRGDPAAAVRAIGEVEAVIRNAVAQDLVAHIKRTDYNENSSVDFSDLDVESTLSAIQSQIKVLSGVSGSSTFRGLKADREYLVAVYGVARFGDGKTIGGMGFTTTTIESGETKTVSLSLDENRDSFKKFLADSYNLTDSPGVRVNLVPIGRLSDLPETLYYDVVKLNGSEKILDLKKYHHYYYGEENYVNLYVTDTPPGEPSFTKPLLLSEYTGPSDGELVGDGDTRKPLPSNNRIESIAGVERGDSIQLIITDQKNRGTAPFGKDRFVIGVSDSFTFEDGQDRFIRMYAWGPGVETSTAPPLADPDNSVAYDTSG